MMFVLRPTDMGASAVRCNVLDFRARGVILLDHCAYPHDPVSLPDAEGSLEFYLIDSYRLFLITESHLDLFLDPLLQCIPRWTSMARGLRLWSLCLPQQEWVQMGVGMVNARREAWQRVSNFQGIPSLSGTCCIEKTVGVQFGLLAATAAMMG